ncbi:MAG: hypothetical protein F4Y02_08830 [Chloroflexi bacterium]|nr:hypothetical protein [Chloroflexota bacterium]
MNLRTAWHGSGRYGQSDGGHGPWNHRIAVRLVAFLAASSIVLGTTAGCGDSTTEPPPPTPDLPRPTTVTITPATSHLTALGATIQLTAQLRHQNGQAMASPMLTWVSSATGIATVDGTGLVTAAGNDTATITASAGEASGTAVAVVMQSASSATVSPATDTIAVGDTLRLAADAFEANGQRVESAEFTWASSDESVATVDASGLVRGIAESTTSITATAGSAQGTARITVASPHYAPPSAGRPTWTLTSSFHRTQQTSRTSSGLAVASGSSTTGGVGGSESRPTCSTLPLPGGCPPSFRSIRSSAPGPRVPPRRGAAQPQLKSLSLMCVVPTAGGEATWCSKIHPEPKHVDCPANHERHTSNQQEQPCRPLGP